MLEKLQPKLIDNTREKRHHITFSNCLGGVASHFQLYLLFHHLLMPYATTNINEKILRLNLKLKKKKYRKDLNTRFRKRKHLTL